MSYSKKMKFAFKLIVSLTLIVLCMFLYDTNRYSYMELDNPALNIGGTWKGISDSGTIASTTIHIFQSGSDIKGNYNEYVGENRYRGGIFKGIIDENMHVSMSVDVSTDPIKLLTLKLNLSDDRQVLVGTLSEESGIEGTIRVSRY